MRPPKLLVVEDNPGDIDLLRRAFKHHSVEIELETLSDGERALERIDVIDLGGETPPDGVLLDLSLPKIDGIEVLQRIRRSSVFGSVPVLVLSGSDNPADKTRILAAGATKFLVKPSGLYAYLQIGAIVKEMLGRPAIE